MVYTSNLKGRTGGFRMILRGNIVDVKRGEVYAGEVVFEGGVIREVRETRGEFSSYILPGLIDAHIHIESSMLVPSRFAEVAATHGTVAVVADPHEIANVLGIAGIEYMIRDASHVPLKFYFTAPSCVPATPFETSGARLGVEEVASLLAREEIVALGEVMNYPGVVARDPEVMAKLNATKKLGKPIDGHCPGLRGEALRSYVEAGISTEHECTSLEEAEEKAKLGMKIMLREGSSAKNLKALARFKGEAFLVSDDVHAKDLLRGHVNYLLRRAVEEGMDEVEAVRRASLYPAKHYRLNVGMLREGDTADIVVVRDLRSFTCIECYINGTLVAARGKALFEASPLEGENTVKASLKSPEDFRIQAKKASPKVRVIRVVPGEIVTDVEIAEIPGREIKAMPERDILKLAVVERYGGNGVATALVKGFGLKKGAIASSIAHDSHNIIAVAATDEDLAEAVNQVIRMHGGIAVVAHGEVLASLALPIAGLMSPEPAQQVAERMEKLNQAARSLGCTLEAPIMALSFLALPVIPKLKLTDRGLFDVERFEFVELEVQ